MPELKYVISVDFDKVKQELSTVVKHADALKESITSNKEETEDASKRAQDEMKGLEASLSALHKNADTMTLTTKDKVAGLLTYYIEWSQITRTRLVEAHGELGRVVGEFIPRQMSGVSSAVSQLRGSILGELPFGGLIGLMLLGGQRFEQIRSQSAEAVRMMQQTGHVGKEAIGELGHEAYRLGIYLGKGPGGMQNELAAAASGFAQFGAKVDELRQKSFITPMQLVDPEIGDNLTIIDESIAKTSMRLDSLFKLPAGAAAMAAGQIMKNFATGIVESQDLFTKLGSAAQNTYQNVQVFTQSVMASGAVLRLQRIDLNEVAESQLKLQRAIAGTIAPGKTEKEQMRWAGGYAEQGMAQITQGIQGMSLGWSAVIGQMMKQQGQLTTTTADPLEVIFRFKEGLLKDTRKPADQEYLTNVILRSVELAQKNAPGNEYAQRMILGAQMGMDPTGPGTRALLEIAKHQKDPKALEQALKENQEHIASAFVDRGQETSNFQRALMLAQDGIAQLGKGILGAVVSAGAAIIQAIKWVYYSWISKDDARAKVAEMGMEHYRGVTDKAWKSVDTAFDEIRRAAKLTGSTLADAPGMGGMAWDEKAAYADVLKRGHRKKSGPEGIGDVVKGVGKFAMYAPEEALGEVIEFGTRALESAGIIRRRTKITEVTEDFIPGDVAAAKVGE